MKANIILLAVFLAAPLLATAQHLPKSSDDFGIWAEIGVEKKLSKKFSLGLDAEYRTEDNLHQNSRWSVGLSGEYKVTKWLKAEAGYTFLYNHNERYTFHDDATRANFGTVNKYASYWGPRHRFFVGLTGDIDVGDWNFSLRERWQYTYRPEKTTAERYDFDDEDWDGRPKTYRGKGKNVLRSRFQVAYEKKGLPIEPYANVEMYNAWNVEKVRYTAGLDWKFAKGQKVGIYYRFQNTYNNEDDDTERNIHILGLGYKIKF